MSIRSNLAPADASDPNLPSPIVSVRAASDRVNTSIASSDFISRDLSWLKFNARVLDQAKKSRGFFEKLKFMAITASNLDEFFMIRIGSLYNYIDYGRERIDYSGLREKPFRKKMLLETHRFFEDQHEYYHKHLASQFKKNHFSIVKDLSTLVPEDQQAIEEYFNLTIYPMLTPMTFDSYHAFPTLMNKLLVFGVVTKNEQDKKDNKKLSFVQIPSNIPRFYEIDDDDHVTFVPIEEIIRLYLHRLFRNVSIASVNLFRITRNGDFTLDESDDLEASFIEEVRRKLKSRKTGRVVRVEVEEGCSPWMMRILISRWNIDRDNIFEIKKTGLLDFTALWSIIKNSEFRNRMPKPHPPVPPLSYPEEDNESSFEVLKHRDVLLHHPYNDIKPLLRLIEQAADDPRVLAIKLTIYRLADDSRITAALLKAAESGKHVSVLFELKARFDEENNMREAQKLHKAGCFVIYGISNLKTHTKLLLIVR